MTASERPVHPPFRNGKQDAKREARRAGKRTLLRVLIVDDSEDEVLLLLSELRSAGYEPLHRRVETPEAMKEALGRDRWDLIIADTCGSHFGAARALALLRQKGLDLPFILASEKIDEGAAVALIKYSGAHDYVIKDDLSSLGPATERVLREAENRKQKPAEEATNRTEAKYRTLFENATEGIFQSTADGRIKTTNPALALILGYASPKELICNVRDVTQRLYADPYSREEFLEQLRRCGTVSGFEARALRKDGSTTWCLVNARATYDEAGEMMGFEGFVDDVSERKRTEEALYESEERFRSTFEQAASGIAHMALDGRILRVNERMREITGYPKEQLLEKTFQEITHPEDRDSDLEQAHQLLVGEIDSYAMEQRYLRKDGSIVWVKITRSLGRESPSNEPKYFIMVAEDMTERKRAEQVSSQLAAIVESSDDAIIGKTLDGIVTSWNRSAQQIYGYSAEEIVGKPIFVLAPPDRYDEMPGILKKVRRGEHISHYETISLKKDGERIGVSINVSPIIDSIGNVVGASTVARDITDRKQTAEVLQASLKKLEDLKSAAEVSTVVAFNEAAIIAFTDQRGKITYVNEKFCQISKYSKEELIGQDHRIINSGYHPKGYIRTLWRTIAQGKVWQGELRNRAKDGSIYWVHTTIVPFLDHRGKPYRYVAIHHDVTERKRAEEALRSSEVLYRTVVEQAAENIFLVDVETKRILEANNALHRSLGYSAEELRRQTLYDFVAHDKESVDSNVRRVLKTTERSFLGERNYRRKDGSLIRVEVTVSPISYGDREAMCIVAHDVTERKQAEDALRRSLEPLLALYEAGNVLGSTLEAEEVGTRLLRIMQRVSKLSTAVISTPDGHGRLHVWRAIGFNALPEKVRYISDLQSTFQSVLKSGEPRVLRYENLAEDGESSIVLVVLPLRIQNRIIGVLEAYGSEEMLEKDTVEILSGLAGQAASALENARLYEALAKRERQLEELVGKLLTAQEEERRKVAYEVHDGLAQVAVAAHQRLQAFSRRFSPSSEKGRNDLDRILGLVQKTVGDSRRIIADLRPTALDDFGLGVALRQEVEELQDDGWQVEYEEGIGDERLPAPVEVALFRVAQEALTNMRKHAQTDWVRLVLGRRQGVVELEVRDLGRGFDPDAVEGTNGPGERIGLSGMRERVSLLGGKLEVRSRPGGGTSITARVPVSSFEENGQKQERDER